MADQDGKETVQHDVSSTASTMINTSSTEDFEKDGHTLELRTTHFSSSAHHSIHSEPLSPPNLLTNTQRLSPTCTKTGASLATSSSRLPSFEVDFVVDDPEDPRNWPMWYKGLTISAVSFSSWVVITYSTSYTISMPGMMEEFHQTNETIATLGMTFYLVGLSLGSLFFAPLSEIYGRRPVYIGSLIFFTLMVLPSTLATSLSEVVACSGWCSYALKFPGTVADISTEQYRALAFSIWSIGPTSGPVTGPLISGFVAQYLGWRWTNWLVLILGGVAWILCTCIKESYAPALLKKKAAKLRKETGDDRWWCRYDQKLSPSEILKVNLSRPFVISFTEPICWFWNGYIAVIYGILYLCFVAYPLIYGTFRGWSDSFIGLSFLGIGVGNMLAVITEPLARRIINAHKKDPSTGRVAPEACVSIICVASFLCPIGQLWFSWTSLPITIHWIWPILAGIPFGAGNCFVFIYASNYLAGSYGVYSASALAGNAMLRFLVGGLLPLAGTSMYEAMSPQWAGTLLGLVQVAMIPIPFVFYKWGDRIRARSPLIRQMREDMEKSQKSVASARHEGDREEDVEKEAATQTVVGLVEKGK
ncbi:Citrinin biosynthesis cluster MFS transporter mrr1 [Lachnellula arida]|uniref:Citrinin biosynthesis cluster MFS transporter mrr1 n=1 Tax=Lachnellula arida TaxID=1316785 RepID=A0A8T9BD98_9HELO|nr:Citrinin biosynthesis cluster MFS transporter mrr1 [Lachnellula arida]